ncbi:MAG: Multiple sugar transport system substrate-binding protein [Xylanivirga thermophila]|jgi:multiple sugar transport system substrate-binding protein|uniref:ABC transporter substrate-binding protein n=1 Tax=Xylanivirga thermophila TaxID=2496273 RepID=UPI0039F47F1E
MKRRISLLLVMLIAISILSGCGASKDTADNGSDAVKTNESDNIDKKSNSKKITLDYWTLFSGGDGEFMQSMVDDWNKENPDVQVKNLKLEWGEYYTKLMTSIAANKGPDIGISHSTKLPELVNEGVVASLDEYAKNSGVEWADFNETILNSVKIDGKYYAIPLDVHPQVLFYNKKICKEAGVLDENDNLKIEDGWDNFVNLLTDLKGKLPNDVAPFSFSTTGDDPYRWWWLMYFQMGGSPLISEDGKSVTMNVDKAIEAAEKLKSLYYEHEVIPLNIEDFYKHFQSGQGAIFSSGVWCTGNFEQMKDFEFGVRPIPQFFDKPADWGDSHTLILCQKSKMDVTRAESAVKFMNFIADSGMTWSNAGHVPAKETVIESEEFKKLPYRNDYVKVANTVVYPTHSTKNWPIKDVIIRNLDTIWTNNAAPQEAIDKMIKEIEEIIKG